MSDKIHVRNCASLSVLLDKYATELPVNGKTYFELPFWFSREDGGVVMYLKPPDDLSEYIVGKRLGRPYPNPLFQGLKNE